MYFFERTEPLQDLDRIFSKVQLKFVCDVHMYSLSYSIHMWIRLRNGLLQILQFNLKTMFPLDVMVPTKTTSWLLDSDGNEIHPCNMLFEIVNHQLDELSTHMF